VSRLVKILDDSAPAGQDGIVTEPGLSRLLLEAFRAVDAEVGSALADRGSPELSPGHAAAMLLVDRRGTRLTELAARAGITKQAMMQVLDDLESEGYLRRQPDPRDARAKVVKLTARGVRGRAEARRAISGVDARVRRYLGGRRYDTLRETLESLATPES
jgi:DNA-binding MarR family transcriptional regulator